MLVQLAQGDTVFVVVDLFDGIAPTEFVFNATPVAATAPQLDGVEAFVNQDTQAIGLRMNGLDPENDVVGYNIASIGQFVGTAYPLVVRTALGVTKCGVDEVTLL